MNLTSMSWEAVARLELLKYCQSVKVPRCTKPLLNKCVSSQNVWICGDCQSPKSLEKHKACESPVRSPCTLLSCTFPAPLSSPSQTVKRVSLELGGNAPFLVFDDADLELAAKGVVTSALRNAGQTCICANRVFVHEQVNSVAVGSCYIPVTAAYWYTTCHD